MTQQPTTPAPAAEKTPREVRKLTVEITDEAALAAAFPEVMEQVTETRPNRQKLYPIAKSLHAIGRQVPGVRAYYANESGQAPTGGELFAGAGNAADGSHHVEAAENELRKATA